MIGTRAFLLDMGLPVIWLLMLLAIFAVIVRSKKRDTSPVHVSTSKMTVKGAVAIMIVLFGVGSSVFWMAKQIRCRSTLHNLTADSVASISIGNTTLGKQEDLGLVIGALRGAKWYKPIASDGGWAKTLPLVIHLKSGEDRRYRIGRMLRQEGAVIDFISQDPNSQFLGHYGYAFAKGLPQLLDQIGAPLPSARNGS